MNSTNSDPALEKVIQCAIRQFEPAPDTGVGVAIFKHGTLYYANGFGFSDRVKRTKVDAQTLFPIGSATKAFNSMAAAILAEQLQISLTLPIKQYLRDFTMVDPQAEEMTLVDILCQRTGMPRYDALWCLGPFTRSQLYYRIGKMDPIPGGFRQVFTYNNIMYMVAGYVLETVTGETWEQLVQTRILDPLGMSHTNFTLAEFLKSGNRVKGYEGNTELALWNFDNIGPAGEINSNVLDLAKWVELFLRRGEGSNGKPIVGSAAVADMFTSRIDTHDPFHDRYGLGWYLNEIGGKRIAFHPGDALGAASYVSLLPDEGLGVVLLTNQHCTIANAGKWPNAIAGPIYQYLLAGSAPGSISPPGGLFRIQASPAPPAAQASPGSWQPEEYAGMFLHPGFGDVSVRALGVGVRFSYYGTEWPLTHVANDWFIWKVSVFGDIFLVPIGYKRDAAKKITGLTVQLAREILLVKR